MQTAAEMTVAASDYTPKWVTDRDTDFIYWRPHAKRNMVSLNPDRYASNVDAMSRIIAWAGNMTCSNRSLQGVIVE